MDPVTLGIGAVGGLVGKLFDHQNAKKMAKQQYKQQKEFAQHGVRWRAEDAKKAGLHPLAALGMQATGYNPVSYGSDFGSAGQDIGRAVGAGLTQEERGGMQGEMAKLAVEKAKLENDFLRVQIGKLSAPGTPPARPGIGAAANPVIPSQGDAQALVRAKPQEVTATTPDKIGQTPGYVPDITYGRTNDGGAVVYPSKDAKELMEDMVMPQAQWSIRNFLPQPPHEAPPGQEWLWNPLTGKMWLRKIQRRGFTGAYAE